MHLNGRKTPKAPPISPSANWPAAMVRVHSLDRDHQVATIVRRQTIFAFLRTFDHAALNVATGRIVRLLFQAGKTRGVSLEALGWRGALSLVVTRRP